MSERVFRRVLVLFFACAALHGCVATDAEISAVGDASDTARSDGHVADVSSDTRASDAAVATDAQRDAPGDTARDVVQDSTSDAAPSADVEACLASMQPCATGTCCPGLQCGTTTLGHVCCGNQGAPCVTADGSDCCGDLECVSGHCQAPACLASMQPCSSGVCCAGLTCGTTSLGHVCCGNQGAPCVTADGSDCCGALDCISGHCGYPSGSGVISACTESVVLAAAPANAVPFIQRALTWVNNGVQYSQTPQPAEGGYRTDCSGLVSMAWGRPPPGETTYSFAGGPWDDHSSVRLGSWDDIQIGDATNYPGDPSAGTGHIRLFAGWMDSAHTTYCTIEEFDYGNPAVIRTHWLDRSIYIPIRLAGFTP